jgi:hypothetical protein
MIVPLALPNGGRFETLDREQKEYSRQQLETANMREWSDAPDLGVF